MIDKFEIVETPTTNAKGNKSWVAWYDRRKALIRELKKRPCVDCGLTFPPVCMDFDHRDPSMKIGGISEMIGRCGLKAILAEIEKCDLVCANCHRVREELREVSGNKILSSKESREAQLEFGRTQREIQKDEVKLQRDLAKVDRLLEVARRARERANSF